MVQKATMETGSDLLVTAFPKRLDIAQVSVYGLSILSAGIFLLFPFVNLFHPSPWQRWMGTLHGFGSLFAMVVMAYAGHLAFPLLRGSSSILPQMRTLSFWSAILSFLAISTGNLAYMRYRADGSMGGARAWLKENSPLGQYVLMEYHEFSVLFTLPISIACAWVLWKYGDSILERKNQAVLAATSVALMGLMFFSIGGMLTGLGVAKLHAL
jgi:small-conductance mechanosensitive channel